MIDRELAKIILEGIIKAYENTEMTDEDFNRAIEENIRLLEGEE